MTLPPLIAAMRPRQWSKNVFVLAGIVFAGRMIAYNWFDCAKQPPRMVSNLAGCTPETASPHGASR